MKTRTNIALLAVLLALCVGYWYAQRSKEQHKINVAEAKRLFAFAPTDITSITIEREGERASTGVRDAGSWRITAPMTIPANSLIWERVAKNIAELTNQRTVTDPGELSVYKLDQPRLIVRATAKDGTKVDLRFGEMDPTQKFRFAQSGGDTIFLAAPNQFFELDRDLTWLRDCELFNEGKAGISYIEYTPMRAKAGTADGDQPVVERAVSVIAEKDAQGLWSVVAPTPGTADQEMLNTLAGDLQFARGRDYVDAPEDLKDYQLDPPKTRVRVKGEDGQLQTAYFGAFEPKSKENPGIYAMQEGQPSVFVVDAQIVNNFPQAGPDAWREKRLITRQGSDITSIKYSAGPQQFLLVNEEGGWKLKEPQEEATDQMAVSGFIAALLEMKGKSSYPERKPYFGLDVPSIRIAITYKDVAEPAEILVGAQDPTQGRYFVTQDSGVVTMLPENDVEKLKRSPKDFMARSLMSFNQVEAREMKLTLEDTAYAFSKGEQAWLVREPGGKVLESQDDMRALLGAFDGLNAESVESAVTPPDLSILGLDKPTLTVTVTTQNEAGESTTHAAVSIGKICPDDNHLRYAMVAGRPQVYRVKQAPVSTVREALRGVIDQ
ncbi:MAG: DUF4340 domain-containing protein [Candidatus Hydrogenedentes bacterium]|nr:DUF4340 domain-containing protein [Candidatus Hydrogenedentota bacterium]